MKFIILTLCLGNLFAGSITLKDLEQKQAQINKSGYQYNTGSILIYDHYLTEVPELKIIPFDTSIDDKSICIVTYSSLNPPYSYLPSLLFKTLKSKFKGHLLCRKGGWPNHTQGCLNHATSGYGFKVCAIQEAFDLGYKKVLWLDSIMEVMRDLSPLFRFLDFRPCVYRYSGFPFMLHVNKSLLKEFNLSRHYVARYRHIASGVLGFNFDFPICQKALSMWHETTKKDLIWPKNFPEQLLISIIFAKLGLDRCAFGNNLLKIHQTDPDDCLLRLNAHRKYQNINENLPRKNT